MPINFPLNPTASQTYVFNGVTWVYDGTVWNLQSSGGSGGGGGGGGEASDSFTTISVPGQSSIIADSSNDTLNVVAGSNVTITTNAETDTITIAAAGGGGGGEASDSFSTVAVTGQSSVVADGPEDTLNLVAGSGISITTNAGTDTITITNTASAGSSVFSSLTDAQNAALTVDKIYLPAITRLLVTNVGASAYQFDQYGSSPINNPTLYAISGTTIAFNLSVAGHPFLIQTGAGNNFDIGLIHVTTAGVVTTSSAAQGKTSGTLYWKIPFDISGGFRYQCGFHAAMVGSIVVKSIIAI